MLAPSPPALPEAFLAPFNRPALTAQRRRLAAQARGRVLDLGGFAANLPYGPAVEDVVAVEPTGLTSGAVVAEPRLSRVVGSVDELADDEAFDCALGVLHLAALADDAGALERMRRLRRLLVPDGRLLLFEPLRRPGWRGVAVDSVVALRGPGRRARHRRGGVRTAHAVPELARSAGLVPTSVERITMPSPLPPLRWCVRMVAVPASAADSPGAAP